MGKASRDKGARFEREIVHELQEAGFAAEKVSRMYITGADIVWPFLGIDREIECKKRASGTTTLYKWLEGRFVVIHKADRKEALVTLRLRDAKIIAALAEKAK